MALAISTPSSSAEARPSTKTRAVSRTSLAALIASMATIPMVYALVVPVAQITVTRDNDATWLGALVRVLVLVAPATYALFCALTSDLTKRKVAQPVRRDIVRFALFGALPYVVIAGAGFATGILALKVIGMVTVPVAIAATVWYSNTRD